MDVEQKALYLTFDDGPTEEVTEWTLNTLRAHNAKATFFCIGKNVQKHPEIYQRILQEGHAVGNHTFDHLKGWKTNTNKYIESIDQCAEWVDSNLFRPPYGRIKKNQISQIKDRYKIVMWDVLSCDYKSSLTAEKCFNKVKKQASNGSIVVFHDSQKACKNLYKLLPLVLKYYADLGFEFKRII